MTAFGRGGGSQFSSTNQYIGEGRRKGILNVSSEGCGKGRGACGCMWTANWGQHQNERHRSRKGSTGYVPLVDTEACRYTWYAFAAYKYRPVCLIDSLDGTTAAGSVVPCSVGENKNTKIKW